jgi:hypothetical protein
MLKCYTIHENKLYDLLKNYKYNVTDEYTRKAQLLGEFPTKHPKSMTKPRQSIKKSIKTKGGGKRKTKNKK